ncbi:MAG: hypothetical protein JWN66_5019 [Sphingomonas bacterium]|nr:hypothetical protein [Sphingomonas bacterium]
MLFPLFMLIAAPAAPADQVDPRRLAAELAADADVVRSLRQNGDVPTIVRPVDVRFVGIADRVAKLVDAAPNLGWRVIQTVAQQDGTVALDLQRDQSTEGPALRALTEEALRTEAMFGVRYDGWGTAAESAPSQ